MAKKQNEEKLDPEALNLISHHYHEAGQLDKALKYLLLATKLNPNLKHINYNLSICYAEKGEYWINIDPRVAKDFFNKAIKINPNNEIATLKLAICAELLDQKEDSIFLLNKILKLNPNSPIALGHLYHQSRDVCDFQKADEIKEKIIKAKIQLESGIESILYNQNQRKNLNYATYLSQQIIERVKNIKKDFNFSHKKIGNKIRIGYLSSDFKDHATSHLMMGVLKNHNRDIFDIYTYSYGNNDKSFYRQEIQKITKFKDIINLSHIQSANQIYKDKIDLLMDLKGHTANSRLEILALKPAPIQISWLGFPGTTGANFIDYIITDKIITPPSDQKYFTEKFAYMPNTYQPTNDKQAISDRKFNYTSLGLPGNPDTFIFSSFNQTYKFEPKSFDSWMRILKKVPGSILWLFADNKIAATNLIKEVKKRGIDTKRIFFATSLPKDEHLKRIKFANIALDTFTYNGHTTTSDCLWAGVPVVTLKGKHFASRVSASLLTAVGLPELITHSQKEYEDLAIELATNPKKLASVRKSLEANRLTKPLFDTKLFVKNLEKLYIKVYESRI